ncbi:hypothetical protein ACEE23_01625 [Corynebacterium sp. 32222D000AT]|uniref:hypothetical protein n=1 Tax=unclassified Corynebacterium TaxID=2624378 RepID=UPI002A9A36CD|nr:hypothetical protein [Mycobacteriaceae bacterium]MDY5830114.1 hypothetical protein [Corynebacterium sp.]
MDDKHSADAPEEVGRSHRPYSPVDPQVNPSADQSRPDYQPREGLSGSQVPETGEAAEASGAAQPKRKRALPRSQVTPTLRLLIALVIVAALIGLFV